uniref:Tr-type G domain-containing protein n=1 Tax=Trichogramma kaykai TaxID=54128 RepID=A0ABD2WGH2_9HYME
MSRHRDVRSMNYSDEYDGYDDVYGHSVEDDYCVSPSAEQFMFDRSKQPNISSFFTEPDIQEDNEEIEDIPSSYKLPQLSDLDAAKLMSCIEAIKNVIGDTHPESELNKKIIEFNFNTEAVLNSILNEESSKKITNKPTTEKDIDNLRPDFTTSSKIVPKLASQVSQPTVKVIPAAAARSITKGFDVCGTNENIESLGTSRSQSPCSGRNSPDPLTRDDSSFSRREKKQTALSVLNKSTSSRSQSPAVIDEGRVAEDKRDALAIYRSKRAGCKEQLHLICVGHVDAGKSTLLGRLLCDLGQVSSKLMHKYQQESKKIGKQSFAYAWVLDETGEERERGITMDVGQSKFETSTKAITLLDAPGHKDFIPNMIIGATQADVALLVVDATRGEFETGFDSGGQTREHALLLRSLGVSQLAVVVNKLDTVNWSKERFNEIVNKISVFLKQAGFKETVTCVPCSGLSGENIVTKPKAEGLSNWYTGPTLVEVIDNFKCPERPVDKPLRFSVNDIFKNIGSGFSISGHMETGMVSVGDKVLVLPRNEPAVIKGIQADDANITHAFAGDQVCLSLSGIDQQNLAIGDIVCSLAYPVPTTTCFQAHIVVFQIKMPITNGMSVVLHQQSLVEPAVITKLVAQLNRSSGEVIKKKPRCLIRNTSAIVQITTQRPICVELHKDVKQLGRVMLRVDGTTIAAGLVTKIV